MWGCARCAGVRLNSHVFSNVVAEGSVVSFSADIHKQVSLIPMELLCTLFQTGANQPPMKQLSWECIPLENSILFS